MLIAHFGYQGFIQNLLRLSPSQLFSEATTTLMVPTIRTLGPVTVEQAYGAIAGPLPGQSLPLVWPQLTCLIAGLHYFRYSWQARNKSALPLINDQRTGDGDPLCPFSFNFSILRQASVCNNKNPDSSHICLVKISCCLVSTFGNHIQSQVPARTMIAGDRLILII